MRVPLAAFLATAAISPSPERPRFDRDQPLAPQTPLPSSPGPGVPPQQGPLPPLPSPRPPRPPAALAANPVRQRGVALGMFAEDVSFSYAPLLDEIAALGASHVALVVPIYQEHGASTKLALHTRLSPSLAAVAEAIRAARRANLEVTLFPIVRLLSPRDPMEWRGTLAPSNVDAWFGSYGDRMGELAAVAAMTGASRLVIGSELSSLDGDLPRWRPVVERVRGLFQGNLLYSANWDHFRQAHIFDLVDEAGLTAYFDLRKSNGPGDVPALERRWRALRTDIEAWARTRGQPFVFTEVGYRSRSGSSAEPWNEVPGGQVDLEEQRRAFEAFRRTWADAPELGGFYVWNWYGWGGPTSNGYTPRGKPAAEEVRKLLAE